MVARHEMPGKRATTIRTVRKDHKGHKDGGFFQKAWTCAQPNGNEGF